MSEYVLNVESELYGPYHSEEQARFAKYIFAIKHPDLENFCVVLALDSTLERMPLIEPRLLH